MSPFNSSNQSLPQRKPIQKTLNGFSLIELMVVMAIMAVLMSLSGGLMQKSINQQARQVEFEQVGQLFKKLSYQAYYGHGAIKVRLEKNQMKIIYELDELMLIDEDKQAEENGGNDYPYNVNKEYEVEIIDFEQLIFVAQDYNVSSKGVVSPNYYQVFWLDGIRRFELKSLFNELAL
jgi:prepilin-type N-terminal cleavage/methylation domain-containing protein